MPQLLYESFLAPPDGSRLQVSLSLPDRVSPFPATLFASAT
jgi:hypothetical protein